MRFETQSSPHLYELTFVETLFECILNFDTRPVELCNKSIEVHCKSVVVHWKLWVYPRRGSLNAFWGPEFTPFIWADFRQELIQKSLLLNSDIESECGCCLEIEIEVARQKRSQCVYSEQRVWKLIGFIWKFDIRRAELCSKSLEFLRKVVRSHSEASSVVPQSFARNCWIERRSHQSSLKFVRTTSRAGWKL